MKHRFTFKNVKSYNNACTVYIYMCTCTLCSYNVVQFLLNNDNSKQGEYNTFEVSFYVASQRVSQCKNVGALKRVGISACTCTCSLVQLLVTLSLYSSIYKSHPRQLIFLGKSDGHGCAVLLCLVVCLIVLASFLHPSHLSLKHVNVHIHV